MGVRGICIACTVRRREEARSRKRGNFGFSLSQLVVRSPLCGGLHSPEEDALPVRDVPDSLVQRRLFLPGVYAWLVCHKDYAALLPTFILSLERKPSFEGMKVVPTESCADPWHAICVCLLPHPRHVWSPWV